MTPTKFDIYVRQGGRWRRLETIEGGEKDAAVRRAAELDQGGEFDGVRAMAVVEYGSGRAPLETLAWISPHLNKMANVQRQMKNAARVAASAEDAPEGLETDAPDPGLVQSFIDEPVEQPDRPAESKPAPTAKEPRRKRPIRSERPPRSPAPSRLPLPLRPCCSYRSPQDFAASATTWVSVHR